MLIQLSGLLKLRAGRLPHNHSHSGTRTELGIRFASISLKQCAA
jgi:hypothetical protein